MRSQMRSDAVDGGGHGRAGVAWCGRWRSLLVTVAMVGCAAVVYTVKCSPRVKMYVKERSIDGQVLTVIIENNRREDISIRGASIVPCYSAMWCDGDRVLYLPPCCGVGNGGSLLVKGNTGVELRVRIPLEGRPSEGATLVMTYYGHGDDKLPALLDRPPFRELLLGENWITRRSTYLYGGRQVETYVTQEEIDGIRITGSDY